MHSSKPLWKWRPRCASPGLVAGISTRRRVTACDPFSPDTISSDLRPGRPMLLASAWVRTFAISSARLLELLNLGGTALGLVEQPEQLAGFLRDRVGDV